MHDINTMLSAVLVAAEPEWIVVLSRRNNWKSHDGDCMEIKQ